MNRIIVRAHRGVLPALALLAAVLAPFSAPYAHHSAAAYDTESSMSVSGVISRLQWRNPHVIIELDVQGEGGEVVTWPLETAGIAGLVQNGWNKEALAPGNRVTAEIRPTKRGVPGGILRWITMPDGVVLSTGDDAPPGAGTDASAELASTGGYSTVSETDYPGSSGPAEQGMTLPQKAELAAADYKARRSDIAKHEASNRPATLPTRTEDGNTGAFDPDNRQKFQGVALYDFSGVWAHRPLRQRAEALGGRSWDFLPVPELTEKSKEIQADILARREAGDVTSDPATLCYPHGLQRSMTRIGNMMLFQIETALFMVHRMNNDYRAIYWDGRDHVPADIRVDSYNGDSIAHWEDDHLYVETVGFGQPLHYVNTGIPIGPQGRVEERWRLINDGNTLEIEFRMTDPEHWEGEWIDYKYWDRILGADIAEANCIVAQDSVLAIGAE